MEWFSGFCESICTAYAWSVAWRIISLAQMLLDLIKYSYSTWEGGGVVRVQRPISGMETKKMHWCFCRKNQWKTSHWFQFLGIFPLDHIFVMYVVVLLPLVSGVSAFISYIYHLGKGHYLETFKHQHCLQSPYFFLSAFH